MSVETGAWFCYNARVNFKREQFSDDSQLRGRLISHALFLDFEPQTPWHQAKRQLVTFFGPIRKGLENRLVELMYVMPHVQRFFGEAVPALLRQIARWMRGRAKGKAWLLLFALATAWLVI